MAKHAKHSTYMQDTTPQAIKDRKATHNYAWRWGAQDRADDKPYSPDPSRESIPGYSSGYKAGYYSPESIATTWASGS